jgi:DNA polymerase I-like protein with 3'-5' exonuclease and polymerase domains
MTAAKRKLSEDETYQIERISIALVASKLRVDDLPDALRAVRAAARRGAASVPMSASARDRFDRGMVALDKIIIAIGGSRG